MAPGTTLGPAGRRAAGDRDRRRTSWRRAWSPCSASGPRSATYDPCGSWCWSSWRSAPGRASGCWSARCSRARRGPRSVAPSSPGWPPAACCRVARRPGPSYRPRCSSGRATSPGKVGAALGSVGPADDRDAARAADPHGAGRDHPATAGAAAAARARRLAGRGGRAGAGRARAAALGLVRRRDRPHGRACHPPGPAAGVGRRGGREGGGPARRRGRGLRRVTGRARSARQPGTGCSTTRRSWPRCTPWAVARVRRWCCWPTCSHSRWRWCRSPRAGSGSSRPGLTSILVLAGVSSDQAVLGTLLYRLFSFWLPIPLGVLAWTGWRFTAGQRSDA